MDQTAKLILGILLYPGVLQIIFFHSDRVQYNFVLSRIKISIAQKFNFVQCFIDKLDFDVFSGTIEILLDLLLRLEPIAVFSTEIDAELFILFDDFKREHV